MSVNSAASQKSAQPNCLANQRGFLFFSYIFFFRSHHQPPQNPHGHPLSLFPSTSLSSFSTSTRLFLVRRPVIHRQHLPFPSFLLPVLFVPVLRRVASFPRRQPPTPSFLLRAFVDRICANFGVCIAACPIALSPISLEQRVSPCCFCVLLPSDIPSCSVISSLDASSRIYTRQVTQ